MNKGLQSEVLLDVVGDGLRELRRRLASSISSQHRMRDRAKIYEDKPIDLLISASNILAAAASFTHDPGVKKIHEDFYRALKKFTQADAADLGEAFNLQRPKHWNQESERFWKQKMAGIEIEIDDLRAEMPVMDAIENVANKHCKGVSKIRDDYYSYKKVMLPFRCGQLDHLETWYYETKGFNCDGKPFCQWISSDSAKLECKTRGINYKPLMKILEKNDWEPNPIPE